MKKHIISIMLCVTLCFCISPAVAFAATERDTSFEKGLAEDLKALGLFKGVSATEFDLNRNPTRVEAIVMLIRLLGKESDALNNTSTHHPFTDVPAWADSYVGYAYQMGLTNGSSATKFGTGSASSAMYITFVLRALGYSDANGEDFVWNAPFALARSVGILPNCVNTENFWRADIVSVSYAALNAKLKHNDLTLAQKLVQVGALSQFEYAMCYDPNIFDELNVSQSGVQTIHYTWEWEYWTWDYDLQIPMDILEAYQTIERNPCSYFVGYSDYVYEQADDFYIHTLAQKFLDAVYEKGYDRDAAVLLAICFVQSLKYTSDEINHGYDYPKYPLETLYDQGGDCEDTSILLASLVREMGYDCCLVLFDDHLGVGVLGSDDLLGYYYELNGKKYYYIETTSPGWEIGDLPDELIYKTATLWPV